MATVQLGAPAPSTPSGSNTDSVTSQDRQAQGAQPDNTPVGSAPGSNAPPGPGTGTVTSVATGTGLTGGPITGSGTIALANTAVTPATYGDATHVSHITVDQQGRITAASSVAITFPAGYIYEFNVVATYGADPTGATDSSGAFSSAIGGINASTFGGRLVIPHGQYLISNAITTITNNCDIWGAGKGVTQVNFAASVAGFTFNFGATARHNAACHDLTMNTLDTGAGQTAIAYTQFNNSVIGSAFSFYNLEFGNGWGTGININDTAQNNIQGSSIYDCYFWGSLSPNANFGITLYGAGNVSIWGCKIFQVTCGIYIDGSKLVEGTWITDCLVVNCNIGVNSQGNNTWCSKVHVNISTSYGSSGYGLLFAGNQNHADHCYFLGNDSTAIMIASTGTYDIISNIRGLNNSGNRWSKGIQVSGGSGQKVHGCCILNCSGAAVDLTGSSYADVDDIAFNDIIGATALVAGTNSFIRNCVGNGSNVDTSWTPGHY